MPPHHRDIRLIPCPSGVVGIDRSWDTAKLEPHLFSITTTCRKTPTYITQRMRPRLNIDTTDLFLHVKNPPPCILIRRPCRATGGMKFNLKGRSVLPRRNGLRSCDQLQHLWSASGEWLDTLQGHMNPITDTWQYPEVLRRYV